MKVSGLSLALSSIAVSLLAVAGSFAEGATARRVLNFVELNGVEQSKYVAVVERDTRSKTMKVEIFNDRCDQFNPTPGVRCMAAAALIEQFETPYTLSIDSCGNKIYQASFEQLADVGVRVELSFSDNSSPKCKYLVARPDSLAVNIETLDGVRKTYRATTKPAALDGDAAIYEALNIEAEDVNPGIVGASRKRKSVGGLVCEKSYAVVPGAVPFYSCTLTN